MHQLTTGNPYRTQTAALIACASIALSTQLALGQGPTQPSPTSAPTKPLAFDVVSVKQDKTLDSFPGPMFPRNGDGFYGRNVSLLWVMWYAYGFTDRNPDNFSSLPGWVQTDHWDIIAKVSEADLPAFRKLDEAGRQSMLRDLLADRFKLRTHVEIHDKPIYALAVGKGGPKLTPAKPPANELNGAVAQYDPLTVKGYHTTMKQLALYLSNSGLDRPVQDRTGLIGNYDFTLGYSPIQPASSASPDDTTPPSDAAHPFIFTAIREQLGLKLEPAMGTTQKIVVDHIERPSEN